MSDNDDTDGAVVKLSYIYNLFTHKFKMIA